MLDALEATLKTLKFHKLIVAVSGGKDSIALAHALAIMGIPMVIAHLNHGLRGEDSDLDAAFVKEFAEALEVPYVIRKATIPNQGNLEANARKVRYDFLEQVRVQQEADIITTAHHENDQVETILMHAFRGAGLRGLSGMQMLSGKVFRPLLNIKKVAIEAYISEHKLPFREDKSNQDRQFMRNRLRLDLVPKMSDEEIQELLNMSAKARETLAVIHAEAEVWIRKQVSKQSFLQKKFKALDKQIQAEVLLQLLGPENLYSKALLGLIELIETGETGKQMTLKGKTFEVQYGSILISETTDHCDILPKQKLGRVMIEWGEYQLKNETDQQLFVRPWKPGDKFQPAGMNGHKKLQDFFTDCKIPRTERHELPIIVNEDDEILAVADLRFDERAGMLRDDLLIQKL